MQRLNTIQSKMALNHRLAGNTQVVTLMKFRTPLNISLIEARLRSFRESHPIFNSSITKQDGYLYFSPSCEELPLSIVDGNIPDKLEIAHEEMKEVIDSAKILWRLRVYCGREECFAVYTRHHAISDNFTSALFIGNIFNDCSATKTSVPRVSGPINSTLTEVYAYGGEPLIEARNGYLHYSKCVDLTERTTGIAYTLFSPGLTARLAAKAESKSESLNSLLVHHYADIVMQYFRLQKIVLSNAISVRGEDDCQPGCFIDIARVTLELGCSNKKNSDYSKAIQAAKVSSLSSYLPTRLIISQSSFSITKLQEHITEIPLSIALTNNGRFKVFNPEITDMFNVVNRTGSNFPLSLHVSFFSSQLQIIFTFPQPFIDRATIESINSLLVTSLEAI